MENQQTETSQENLNTVNAKSPEGKAVSKFNAVTHGILRQSVTPYEDEFYSNTLDDLITEHKPQGITEQILVERIAINYLKLFRIQKAEVEFIKSKLKPRITKFEGGNVMPLQSYKGTEIVVDEGYIPKITEENVQKLMNTYGRYETTIENRLFRAIHELERTQRLRKGEKVPPPITADINQVGSFGETDKTV